MNIKIFKVFLKAYKYVLVAHEFKNLTQGTTHSK